MASSPNEYQETFIAPGTVILEIVVPAKAVGIITYGILNPPDGIDGVGTPPIDNL